MGTAFVLAETSQIFSVGWADVYGAVRWVVDYGLKHRDLSGVTAIGVDEVHVGKRDKFWTLVYQIDDHCKRLLWIGHDRTEKTFDFFFESSGPTFCSGISFICSDMWKPYLNAAARWVPGALRILDRFHIVKNLNKAIEDIRREAATYAKQRPGFQTRARAEAGLEPLLKKMRWAFLKKRRNWTRSQRRRMRQIEGTPCTPCGPSGWSKPFSTFGPILRPLGRAASWTLGAPKSCAPAWSR